MYRLYQHEWKLRKQEIVWKHDSSRRGGVSPHNFEFFQFPRVLLKLFIITEKCFMYIFYSIAQRYIKKEIFSC